MHVRKVSKGNRSHRTLFCPSPEEKARYRTHLPELAELERRQADHFNVGRVAHAFIQGRNQVTCAIPHIGFDATYSFDLKNWFDSITTEQLIQSGVDPKLAEEITIGGKLRQGLPTSPIAANIAAVRFDRQIMAHLGRYADRYGKFAYTRYADDITISWSTTEQEDTRFVASFLVERSANDFGWRLNYAKSRAYYAKAGRRIVCGISVGEADIRATRDTKRRLRAARFQGYKTQVRSLELWSACLLPRCARGVRRLLGVNGTAVVPPKIATPAPVQITVVSGSARRLIFGDSNDDSK